MKMISFIFFHRLQQYMQMHLHNHFLLRLFKVYNVNYLFSQSLKLFSLWLMLLIDKVDACHICTALEQVTKLCKVVSLFSRHVWHIGPTLMFLFIKLSCVGNTLFHDFQMKCFIFVGIFNCHYLPHGKFSF